MIKLIIIIIIIEDAVAEIEVTHQYDQSLINVAICNMLYYRPGLLI